MKRKNLQTEAVVDDMIEGRIPNNATIYLDSNVLIQVFTKKRLELISLIDEIKPKSTQQLATKLRRKKQAICRDLKLLEGFGILELKKEGRQVIPRIIKDLIYFPIKRKLKHGHLKTLEKLKVENEKPAEVYLNDNINVNKIMK